MAQMRRFELLIARGRIGLLSTIETQGRRIIMFFAFTKKTTLPHLLILLSPGYLLLYV